ncbi:MAG: hypothetical protein QOH56_2847 [Pseudonocardiales bacterium]|jgi:uncharacterized membrane protein YphA (DoxX/SURF4 family)|nr:hypothetical protein [Pseudonocardiales bacterium]
MTLSAKIRRMPLRLATGAFILNAGIGKLKGDEQTAQGLHGMASGAYPALSGVEPSRFLKVVAVSEVAVGGVLLTPLVPTVVAGAALTGFSASLLGMWWRTPGMHQPGNPRPTQQGTAVAKDVWMLGIGLGLVLDALLSRDKVNKD